MTSNVPGDIREGEEPVGAYHGVSVGDLVAVDGRTIGPATIRQMWKRQAPTGEIIMARVQSADGKYIQLAVNAVILSKIPRATDFTLYQAGTRSRQRMVGPAAGEVRQACWRHALSRRGQVNSRTGSGSRTVPRDFGRMASRNEPRDCRHARRAGARLMHRKIGGIHFLRLWRIRLSFCIARATGMNAKSSISYHAPTKTWHVRRFDTIGIVRRSGIKFIPMRLGIHGPLKPTLAKAVAWIERRERRQGIDQP
jgi:hypothetical protein